MSEPTNFTEKEEMELRQAMKKGGIFLKLYSNPDANVDVQSVDKEGNCKTIQTLDRNISAKIKELYNGQTEYKAPLEFGFKRVSISWFIASFC